METKVFKVDSPDSEVIAFSATVIKNGGLVVFPTETVYGLGADALSANAAEKIYAAKGRPSDNPLIIHIANPRDAEKYTYTSEVYYKLAEHFMPGPLTVVMKARDIVPLKTRGGLETVAVRCPENAIARRLIELSDTPIAAPSANLSGSPSPTVAEHVIDDMDGRVDVILDGGSSDFGLESTIVKIDADGKLTLLRPGKITPEDFLALGFDITVAGAVTEGMKDGEVALSPGMKYKHYAPKATFTLLDGDMDAICEFLGQKVGQNVAFFSYEEDEKMLKEKLPDIIVYTLGSKFDEKTQAKNLFRLLRVADKNNHKEIFAPLPKRTGIGLALYNRMIRAAAHTIKKL